MDTLTVNLAKEANELAANQLAQAKQLLHLYKFDSGNERNMAEIALAQVLATNLLALKRS